MGRQFDIPNEPGTYALVLYAGETRRVAIGKLGRFDLLPGYYVYIGSAFGPGGLKARLSRHLRKSKNLRWHVDYLRKVTEVVELRLSTNPERLECTWSAALAGRGFTCPIKGFGSSDCKCESHLFYLGDAEWGDLKCYLGTLIRRK